MHQAAAVPFSAWSEAGPARMALNDNKNEVQPAPESGDLPPEISVAERPRDAPARGPGPIPLKAFAKLGAAFGLAVGAGGIQSQVAWRAAEAAMPGPVSIAVSSVLAVRGMRDVYAAAKEISGDGNLLTRTIAGGGLLGMHIAAALVPLFAGVYGREPSVDQVRKLLAEVAANELWLDGVNTVFKWLPKVLGDVFGTTELRNADDEVVPEPVLAKVAEALLAVGWQVAYYGAIANSYQELIARTFGDESPEDGGMGWSAAAAAGVTLSEIARNVVVPLAMVGIKRCAGLYTVEKAAADGKELPEAVALDNKEVESAGRRPRARGGLHNRTVWAAVLRVWSWLADKPSGPQGSSVQRRTIISGANGYVGSHIAQHNTLARSLWQIIPVLGEFASRPIAAAAQEKSAQANAAGMLLNQDLPERSDEVDDAVAEPRSDAPAELVIELAPERGESDSPGDEVPPVQSLGDDASLMMPSSEN